MIATDGSLHIIMTTCRYSCFFVPCIAIQLCNVNQQNAFCWLTLHNLQMYFRTKDKNPVCVMYL